MSTTVTKADIVDAIYQDTDHMRREVKAHVDALLTIMKEAIKRDNVLRYTGFGKFEAYAMPARKGRNPATNEAMTLEPRKVVVFRLSKKFRGELNYSSL